MPRKASINSQIRRILEVDIEADADMIAERVGCNKQNVHVMRSIMRKEMDSKGKLSQVQLPNALKAVKLAAQLIRLCDGTEGAIEMVRAANDIIVTGGSVKGGIGSLLSITLAEDDED